jgi:ribonuclease BN (tRNA processing enzyme)
MQTKLTFLGAGSAFTFANGQNNLLIEVDNCARKKKMLVDTGTQWQYMMLGQLFNTEIKTLIETNEAKNYRHALAIINLKIATGDIKENEPMKRLIEFLYTIDSIFITHLHKDHCSGLELIGFLTRFVPTLHKLNIYGLSSVISDLWDKELSGGMDSLNYGQMTEEERTKRITIESYFKPHYLTGDPEDAIELGSTIIEPFTTMHISNRLKQVASCGLLIKTFSGKEIMFTSDTQYCPKQLMDMYHAVDTIFHDCETAPFPSGVHAHYSDLKTLPDDVKAKMHLCHYNDGIKPDCKEDGFAGWVEMGDEYIFI